MVMTNIMFIVETYYQRGGGKCFFIAKLLDCTINVIKLGLNYDCIEYLAFDMTYHNEITRLIVAYIAPWIKHESSAFSTLFAEFITQSCSVNYRCCYLGDLNLPNVDCTNGVYQQSHEYTSMWRILWLWISPNCYFAD